MASLFTHAVVGAAIGHAGKPAWHKDRRYWPIVIACSMLPDIDSIGFRLGVPYGSLWGHRGMTHSLLFAFIVAMLAAMVLERRYDRQGRLTVVFFLIMVSHSVLDAMTNGGLGVAFFSPLNTHRYFFPWRPILVSPIWSRQVLRRKRTENHRERNSVGLVPDPGSFRSDQTASASLSYTNG